MMMDEFKHKSAVNDVDIQPFGHSNPNTLDPDTFEYINYFTFHYPERRRKTTKAPISTRPTGA